MSPPPDQSWEFVLQRLDQINESLHALRSEVSGQIGRLAIDTAGLLQWRDSHEHWAAGTVRQQEVNTSAIADLQKGANQQEGALRMLRLLGGVVVGLIALGEFLLHAKGHQ